MAQQQMSLFGPSLAQTQAGIAQEDEAITARLAQLSPEQQLTRVALQGGRQAGKALGGLFGIEDPRLKEAAQQEAIFKELKDSGVDFTDSEQLYPALINAYQSRGMIDKAIVAAAKYEDVKSTSLKTQAELGLKEAQAKQAEAKAKAAGQVKPSELGTLQAERDALRTRMQNSTSELEKIELDQRIKEIDNAIATKTTAKAKAPPSVGTDREAVSLELYNKNFMDLTQPERVAVNKRVEETAQRTKPSVNITVEGEKSFAKTMGEEDAKTVVEARKLRTTAIGELNSLNEMAQRNSQNVTSGTFASGRVGVANFFNTIGLLGAADVQKLANSEVYTKSAGDLVLAKIKALGSNPSNADREFIVRIVPQLENSPQARAELISYLQKRANDVIRESNSLETYARQNKGLSGYVPTIPLTISPQTVKKASDMTDQELIDAYRSGRR